MQHFRNPRTIQNMKIFFIAIFLSFGINLSNAQNINAPGNLESPKPLSCIKLSEVTNENNPADILNGMRKCIDQKDYKNAARLFAIAGVYGKYDSFRVKDKTAHQALLVLQQSIFFDLDESEQNSLMSQLEKELEKGSNNLNEVCQSIQKIGVPKYYPKYMVQHGIQAFSDNNADGLVENFDSQKSWELALKEYLHCGE